MADILNERFTLKNLILKDKLATEHKSLKDVILELEDEVLANAGIDVFEEVFKLIFTKLYDEFKSQEDKMFISRLLRHRINTIIQETDQFYDTENPDYEILKKSVILHWRPDQVAGTVIPILPQEKQAEIRQKVAESFNLRKQAKDLLEYTKRAVEIAIEQNEQTAINWLEPVSPDG